MELATTPITTNIPKRYRLFSIDAAVPAKQAAVKLEFFYIGKDHQLIDLLLHHFEGGFIAEQLENATILLKNIIGKEQEIPAFVLIDSKLGLEVIKKMAVQLQMNPLTAAVPLLVAIGEEEVGLKSDFMSIPLVDDVVLAKNVNQRLVNHVRLLRKAKRAAKEQRFEQKLKQDLNQTHSGINLGKRMFDIFVSGTLLLLLSPLMALIALAIRLESRGPIFYIAKRAGRGYQVFDFFKFRSMRVDADQQIASLSHLNQYDASSGKPVFFKLNNDPRVTRVGNFLRNTSLDELPQLFNVFIGDMSLVGNRPLPLYEAATLTTDEWATRFLAPAGITGLWQIKKRGKAEMSVEERIQLDIDYANKHGFLFDLYIMALTPAALVQKSNV